MKRVAEYEVIDHDFDSEQYFQGCGIAYTLYEDVATGIGDTFIEAFEDATENLAQNDWDTSTIIRPIRPKGWSRKTVRGYIRDLGLNPDEDGAETHCYVSVRVR